MNEYGLIAIRVIRNPLGYARSMLPFQSRVSMFVEAYTKPIVESLIGDGVSVRLQSACK